MSNNEKTANNNGWECYAASKAGVVDSFQVMRAFNDSTEVNVVVELLDYPCCCIKLSTTTHLRRRDHNNHNSNDCHSNETMESDEQGSNCDSNIAATDRLLLLGDTFGKLVNIITSNDIQAPHNVVLLNRPSYRNDNIVDIYVFLRSKERSLNVIPTLKLGFSELMGVFLCQSMEEINALFPIPPPPSQSLLQRDNGKEDEEDYHQNKEHYEHDNNKNVNNTNSCSKKGTIIEEVLKDVSYKNCLELWQLIRDKLKDTH
eukprot:CAMPEP_0171300262 /NCGR_PEP_ID=MMETSP0816-20121228/9047_1 /TAXON_ID=420281 /ORGANISM="Proboscia inermis, Strain CCAP1064/1" /LENGTH=258 /DNA_ID=CAMNT_0011776615 /DNA_START=54 /DNA_END=830 /DNA_ORIENTATION=-